VFGHSIQEQAPNKTKGLHTLLYLPLLDLFFPKARLQTQLCLDHPKMTQNFTNLMVGSDTKQPQNFFNKFKERFLLCCKDINSLINLQMFFQKKITYFVSD